MEFCSPARLSLRCLHARTRARVQGCGNTSLGANVRRTRGTYDDSVSIAQEQVARDPSWILIADTSTVEFEQIPAEVIQGYAVMVHEILEQLKGHAASHVFVQGGGVASRIAWTILARRADAFLTIADETAAEAVRQLDNGETAGVSVDVGLSGERALVWNGGGRKTPSEL